MRFQTQSITAQLARGQDLQKGKALPGCISCVFSPKQPQVQLHMLNFTRGIPNPSGNSEFGLSGSTFHCPQILCQTAHCCAQGRALQLRGVNPGGTQGQDCHQPLQQLRAPDGTQTARGERGMARPSVRQVRLLDFGGRTLVFPFTSQSRGQNITTCLPVGSSEHQTSTEVIQETFLDWF